MSKKVFISYRREDTAPAAGRVYDRLLRLLSKPNVFFDVSTIGGGEDFEKKIASEMGRSDAALIFIGREWLAPVQPTGNVRIWETDDYVRAEVRAALARRIFLLPVLVAGAQMPKPEQLPEDLEPSLPKKPCRFATKVLMTIRRPSWQLSRPAHEGKILGKQGHTLVENRLCGGWSDCFCGHYYPWRTRAFVDTRASATRLNWRTRHRAGADLWLGSRRLAGFTL